MYVCMMYVCIYLCTRYVIIIHLRIRMIQVKVNSIECKIWDNLTCFDLFLGRFEFNVRLNYSVLDTAQHICTYTYYYYYYYYYYS